MYLKKVCTYVWILCSNRTDKTFHNSLLLKIVWRDQDCWTLKIICDTKFISMIKMSIHLVSSLVGQQSSWTEDV